MVGKDVTEQGNTGIYYKIYLGARYHRIALAPLIRDSRVTTVTAERAPTLNSA